MDRILVVDDSIVACSVMQNMLSTHNFEIFMALSGGEAIVASVEKQPDLILLDIVMRGENGYDICEKLKKNPKTREIPIVFITSMHDEASIARGFDCGCVDYVCKPVGAIELLARVQAHIKTKHMRDMLKKANEDLGSMNRRLTKLVKEKELWAKTDQLTKLYNRYYITDMLPQWNTQVRSGRIFSVILADIDNFKLINDTYGHCAGDFVLQCISNVIRYHCAIDHIAVRWGGEEFLIISPDTDLSSAVLLAETLRQRVSICHFEYDGIYIECTVTIGVALIDRDLGLEKSVERADEALYKGKRSGKNCVVSG